MFKVDHSDIDSPDEYYDICRECKEKVWDRNGFFPINSGKNWIHPDCAYKVGLLDTKGLGWYFNKNHAAIHSGVLYLWDRGPKPWTIKKTKKQRRQSVRYKRWRGAVFHRDNHTCQVCKVRGGELNAHHIKHFSKHPLFRYVLSNGITLCKGCHRKEHAKGKTNG